MAERIILDPTEEAAGRTQFDITPWIAEAGPDWGDGAIQAYMADQSRGATPVDFRVGNRTVEIPLILRALGGTSFATVRALAQAKTSLFQREGGIVRRTTTAGSTVYADVVNASLKLGGGWLQSAKDADLDAVLSLECLPDFYEAEVLLADHTETTLSELVFTETSVRGDYPARVRVVVDEDQAQSQLGLIWSFRNRNYSSAATAATRYEAEALTILDTATRAALTGASGGTVVTHGTLSTNWTPFMDMRGSQAGAYPTHTGTNRLWVRYRTTSENAVQLRTVWDVGDLTFPVENTPIRTNQGTQFFMADLGELRLDPTPVGTHRWQGMIQAKGDVGGENVSIDKVWVVNADEGYGVMSAPLSSDIGLVPYSARDEFNQSAGALTAKTAAVGGVWAGAGDADDFTVDATNHWITRTAVSDATFIGRVVNLPVTMTATVAQMDTAAGASTAGFFSYHMLTARYTDESNFLYANYTFNGDGTYNITVGKMVAAAQTTIARLDIVLGTPNVYQPGSPDTWRTLRLMVDASGRYFCWSGLQGGALSLVLSGQDAVLATGGAGGALASGKPGIRDGKTTAQAQTRYYDNFAAWVPSPDAVLYASQSAELRWDGMVREDSTGTAYGPVSQVVGDLPRLPPTVEGRTTEVFIKASRGDFATLPDLGIDDISARITYRPTWLTVPGT